MAHEQRFIVATSEYAHSAGGGCLDRHQPHHTPTTQALPGVSRWKPVVTGSLGDEMPALASNSGS
jgi:hypothetical protein